MIFEKIIKQQQQHFINKLYLHADNFFGYKVTIFGGRSRGAFRFDALTELTILILNLSGMFCRYRGLKSFRTSPWDKMENLPIEYARIFQFEDIQRTFKKVSREAEEGAQVSAP